MKNLILKVIGLLLLIWLSIAANKAHSYETVDKTIDVAKNSFIQITHVNGHANLVGWERDQVQVKGELGEHTEEFRFERDGNSVVIEVKVKSRGNWSWGKNDNDKGDKLTIYIPIKSRLEYGSVNAKVTLDNIDGEADIRVVNGEIRADNLKGNISLESVNGEIYANALVGKINLNSVNGEINGEALQGNELNADSVNGEIDLVTTAKQISVETVNGEIDVDAQGVTDVQASTVNGDVSINMELLENATVNASSVGGRIALGFKQNVSATFDIEAHAGGSIRNRLTDDEPTKAKYGPQRSLEFSTGNPNAHVDISTVSGRIELLARD